MKQASYKTVTIIIALSLIIFLSAFTHAPEIYLTRIALAGMIRNLVSAAVPDIDFSTSTTAFSDLDTQQQRLTTAPTGIMNGFADNTFRPYNKITRREFLWYLYRTYDFLRTNAPDAKITARIAQIVGYHRKDFFYHVNSSFSIFEMNAKANEPVLLATAERIETEILSKPALITAQLNFVNSFSGEPVFPVYVSVNGKTVVSDRYGKAKLDFMPDEEGNYQIFASACGYRSITLKRSFLQNSDLIIVRLKPVTATINIRAFDNKKNRPVQKFAVTVKSKDISVQGNKTTTIKDLNEGYYQLEVKAKGYKPTIKKIFATRQLKNLDLYLEPI